ncbi:MAG: hypothetical protein KJO98_16575 [Rhodothermia bacterium]|nr:hypothetical protein [Rhodothermia bacterium]
MKFISDPIGHYDPGTKTLRNLMPNVNGPRRRFGEDDFCCRGCGRSGVELYKNYRHEGYGQVGSSWECAWCLGMGSAWILEVASRVNEDQELRRSFKAVLGALDEIQLLLRSEYGEEARLSPEVLARMLKGECAPGDTVALTGSDQERSIAFAELERRRPSLFSDVSHRPAEGAPKWNEVVALLHDPMEEAELEHEKTRTAPWPTDPGD